MMAVAGRWSSHDHRQCAVPGCKTVIRACNSYVRARDLANLLWQATTAVQELCPLHGETHTWNEVGDLVERRTLMTSDTDRAAMISKSARAITRSPT